MQLSNMLLSCMLIETDHKPLILLQPLVMQEWGQVTLV